MRVFRSQGTKITSNSWGGGGYSQALLDEINNELAAGNLFITASGNDGKENFAMETHSSPHHRNSVTIFATVVHC